MQEIFPFRMVIEDILLSVYVYLHIYLCSVLKRAKMCLLDMKPFSTSRSFRLSTCSMYFFSFSCRRRQRSKYLNAMKEEIVG